MKAKDLKPGELYRVARSANPVSDTWGGFDIEIIEAGTYEHAMKVVGYFKVEAGARKVAENNYLDHTVKLITEDNAGWAERSKIGTYKLIAFVPKSTHTSKRYAIGYKLTADGERKNLVSVNLSSIKMPLDEWKKARAEYERERNKQRKIEKERRTRGDEVKKAFTDEIDDLFGDQFNAYFTTSYGNGGAIVFGDYDSAEEFLALIKESV